MRAKIEKAVLFCRNLSAAFSSNLTRRANHLHTDIIARSSMSPRRQRRRAFSFAEIGRRRARERPHSLLTSPHARRRPSLQHINQYWPACANRRSARGDARPRPPCCQGIGFAPEMIACKSDHAAYFLLEGNSMDDGVPDLACDHLPGRDHLVRRNVVSAEIVRFISRPRRDAGGTTDFPTIAFSLRDWAGPCWRCITPVRLTTG